LPTLRWSGVSDALATPPIFGHVCFVVGFVVDCECRRWGLAVRSAPPRIRAKAQGVLVAVWRTGEGVGVHAGSIVLGGPSAPVGREGVGA